jgi:hypothetical protein
MPLTAEYEWAETDDSVVLTLQLKGHKTSQVDLFGECSPEKGAFPLHPSLLGRE